MCNICDKCTVNTTHTDLRFFLVRRTFLQRCFHHLIVQDIVRHKQPKVITVNHIPAARALKTTKRWHMSSKIHMLYSIHSYLFT